MYKLYWWQRGMLGVVGATLAFLYIPILVLIIFSFNSSSVMSLPLADFTLDWYRKVMANQTMLHALGNSLIVATCATALTVTIGVPAAFVIERYKLPGLGLFRRTILLPLSLPGIVTGIAMLNFYRQLGIPLGLMAIIIGHATALLGIVVTQVVSRLSRFNRRLEEASQDLGAGPVETFFKVTLPAIRSAIIGSALLAFTLSFDEIPVTYFLTGRENTLPMYIYSTLRRGLTPEINAIGTLIIAVSLLLIIASVSMLKDDKR